MACGDPPSQDTASCDIAAVANSTTGALIQGTLVQNGGWVWNTLSTPSIPACSTSPESPARVHQLEQLDLRRGRGDLRWPHHHHLGQRPQRNLDDGDAISAARGDGHRHSSPDDPGVPSNWTTSVAAGGTSNAVALPGNFYPYANGYSIAAGDCGAEAGYTGSQKSLSAPPGGVADATIPLGLLPLQVVNSSGTAIGGATLTLTATTTSSAADSYTLPPTDAAGITRTSVPYGIYTLTGKAGTTAIPVNPTGSTVTVSIQVGPSSVTVTTNTTVTSTQKTTSVAVTTSVQPGAGSGMTHTFSSWWRHRWTAERCDRHRPLSQRRRLHAHGAVDRLHPAGRAPHRCHDLHERLRDHQQQHQQSVRRIRPSPPCTGADPIAPARRNRASAICVSANPLRLRSTGLPFSRACRTTDTRLCVNR